MSWWKKIRLGFSRDAVPDAIKDLDFPMAGWTEEEPSDHMRCFRGPHRSVLSLAALDSNPWASVGRFQADARELAESNGGGLIEAEMLNCGSTSTTRLIYKRLQMPAYVFTGMFFASLENRYWVWTMVAGECGTTGIREAVVTTQLYESGDFKSPEDYERFWAQDPYDPRYQAVDRRVLRFLSDAEKYDAQFPEHPLSRVRAFQRELCTWIGSRQRAKDQSA
jgi:hypothetical protein